MPHTIGKCEKKKVFYSKLCKFVLLNLRNECVVCYLPFEAVQGLMLFLLRFWLHWGPIAMQLNIFILTYSEGERRFFNV